MLIFDFDKLIKHNISHGKRSMYLGECGAQSIFFMKDALVLTCRVPHDIGVLSARMELYRHSDMSTRSIKAERTSFDAEHNIFEVRLMLSNIIRGTFDELFYYTFILETPHGKIYTSRDGTLTHRREEILFEELRVVCSQDHDGDYIQNSQL